MINKIMTILFLITLLGCNQLNSTKSCEGAQNNNEKLSQENFRYEKINDKYCRIIINGESLPESPFNYELTVSNILTNVKATLYKIESIKYDKAIENDSIITYYFGNSYIKVYNNNNNKYFPLEFDIKDRSITLANGLEIDKDRLFFNSIYNQAKELNDIDCIGICDESEFSEVYFYFKKDTIYRIVYVNSEFDN